MMAIGVVQYAVAADLVGLYAAFRGTDGDFPAQRIGELGTSGGRWHTYCLGLVRVIKLDGADKVAIQIDS